MDGNPAEQEPFLGDVEERERRARDPRADDGDPAAIVPMVGRLTRGWAQDLTGVGLDYATTERTRSALAAANLGGWNPAQFHVAMDRYQATVVDAPPAPVDDDGGLRPSDREGKIRGRIEGHCRSWASRNGAPWGTLNKEMYARYGKPRKDMTEDELKAVWVWLQHEYPLA